MFEWAGIAVAIVSLAGTVFVLVFGGGRTLTQAQIQQLRDQKKVDDDDRIKALRGDWQETTLDLDDLWRQLEDDILPWMRAAYTDRREGSTLPPPPQLRRRKRDDAP